MLLLEDEVVPVLEEESPVVVDEEAALTAAAGVEVATGATELDEEEGLGFCLVGQAVAEMAEMAMSMVWNLMVSRELLWEGMK